LPLPFSCSCFKHIANRLRRQHIFHWQYFSFAGRLAVAAYMTASVAGFVVLHLPILSFRPAFFSPSNQL